jgi:hypothetical protein
MTEPRDVNSRPRRQHERFLTTTIHRRLLTRTNRFAYRLRPDSLQHSGGSHISDNF